MGNTISGPREAENPAPLRASVCRTNGTFSKSGCESVGSADTLLAHVGKTFGPKLITYIELWATYWRFVDR